MASWARMVASASWPRWLSSHRPRARLGIRARAARPEARRSPVVAARSWWRVGSAVGPGGSVMTWSLEVGGPGVTPGRSILPGCPRRWRGRPDPAGVQRGDRVADGAHPPSSPAAAHRSQPGSAGTGRRSGRPPRWPARRAAPGGGGAVGVWAPGPGGSRSARGSPPSAGVPGRRAAVVLRRSRCFRCAWGSALPRRGGPPTRAGRVPSGAACPRPCPVSPGGPRADGPDFGIGHRHRRCPSGA